MHLHHVVYCFKKKKTQHTQKTQTKTKQKNLPPGGKGERFPGEPAVSPTRIPPPHKLNQEYGLLPVGVGYPDRL